MAKNKNKKNTTIKAEESVKENKPYLVSVITTYYNAKNFILDAVRSITKQRYVDGGVKFTIEYVIVDDCSPDETHDILSKYIEEYESTKSQHPDMVLNMARVIYLCFLMLMIIILMMILYSVQ